MINIAKRCRELCSKLVRRIGYCEICGETFRLEAHHPFGRKCHPSIQFNPDLGVCLCTKDHNRFGQENLEGLLAELLPILLFKQPERAELLQEAARTYKMINSTRIDYKIIWAELKQFERDHSDGWMEPEIEYGRMCPSPDQCLVTRGPKTAEDCPIWRTLQAPNRC